MEVSVKQKFDSYPDGVREKLLKIREGVFDVAKRDNIGEIIETLKWGEPSYLSKKGSTVRMDWKGNHPDTFSVYFNCNTLLVETFREIYRDVFQFEGNREIVFSISEPIPMSELKTCISMALRYHEIKQLPLLGA